LSPASAAEDTTGAAFAAPLAVLDAAARTRLAALVESAEERTRPAPPA